MPTDDAPLLRPRDLAHLLCISERHLRDIRTQAATLPAPTTVGASPRWRPQDVSDWLARYESKRTSSTATPAVPARPARRRSNPVAAAEQKARALPQLRPEIPVHAWGLAEVQHHLNISARTLRRLREQDPTFPAPRYLGAAQRWHPHAVRAWEPQRR
jgi:predicted DNA-binding transcriptional regulator AlpA